MVLQVAVPAMANVLGLFIFLHLKVEVATVTPDEDGPDHLVLLPPKANREALREMLKVGLVQRHFEDGNMDWCEGTTGTGSSPLSLSPRIFNFFR